ncbi:MAG: hypothetical protein IKZ84_14705, partial [Victivallales bacterium]|nr:hypothetical protein [Victivallales bacterium]
MAVLIVMCAAAASVAACAGTCNDRMTVVVLAPFLVDFELLHRKIQPFGDDVVHLAVAHLDICPAHGAV